MFGIENYSEAIVKYGAEFDISQLGKAALFGGSMVLIGMATIFAVLCMLWACLALFKVVFSKSENDKADKVKVEESTTNVVSAQANNDDEIVAVIAAAIAMAEAENSELKFRVVSFKRK